MSIMEFIKNRMDDPVDGIVSCREGFVSIRLLSVYESLLKMMDNDTPESLVSAYTYMTQVLDFNPEFSGYVVVHILTTTGYYSLARTVYASLELTQ